MQTGQYRIGAIEKIVWGNPAAATVAAEADAIGAKRVFIVASGTLARETDEVGRIRDALAGKYAGLFDRCREHTPLESVIACAAAVRGADADLIVTVGGGTAIDTVKIVQLCLTLGINTVEALLQIAGKPNRTPSKIRQIAVPTTLSGGEHTSMAGGTDTKRKTKDSYLGPDLCARVIVLVPAITTHTPERLWLSTGMRAVDHAAEGYCAAAGNPLTRATALEALSLFSKALPQTKTAPADLDARLNSQMAVWLAAQGLGRVSMGASHGIGYILGAMCGVPHGYTSCVMLPAVLTWSERDAREAQRDIARAMGRPNEPSGKVMREFVGGLGLPVKLSDVGVAREQFQEIAERAARHPVVRANVRPIQSAGDIMEILELAA